MSKLVRAEIWSDTEAGGGSRLLAIPGEQILKAVMNEDLKGRQDVQMQFDHAIAVRSAAEIPDTASAASLVLTSAPGPLFRDQFNRPDSNTVGGGWTEVESTAGGNQILSNALRQLAAENPRVVQEALASHPADFIVQVTTKPGSLNTYQILARGFDWVAQGPDRSTYASAPSESLDVARLFRVDHGVSSLLGSVSVTQVAGEFWQDRMVGIVEGANVRLKNYLTKVSSLTDLTATPVLRLNVLDTAVPSNLADEVAMLQGGGTTVADRDEFFLCGLDVFVIGLPSGFSARVDGGTPVVESGGTAAIRLDTLPLPFTLIEVLDTSATVVAADTPVGGGWGDETYTFTPAIVPFTRGDENRVLRSVFNPTGILESRIVVPIETRASDGGETSRLEAQNILIDLNNGLVQRTEADGSFVATFTLLSFTLEELVDFILLSAPDEFVKGDIDTPTLVIEAFSFDFDTPLSALQELAQLAGLELGVRRNAAVEFLVDIVVQTGLQITPTLLLTSPVGLLLRDDFDRPNQSGLGNGWSVTTANSIDISGNLAVAAGQAIAFRSDITLPDNLLIHANLKGDFPGVMVHFNNGAQDKPDPFSTGTEGYILRHRNNLNRHEGHEYVDDPRQVNGGGDPGNTLFAANRIRVEKSGANRILRFFATNSLAGSDTDTAVTLFGSFTDTSPLAAVEFGFSLLASGNVCGLFWMCGADVIVTGLPTGFGARIDGGATVIEVGGIATIDVDALLLPFALLEVLDDLGSVVASNAPVDFLSGGWGGETYDFQSSPHTPQFRLRKNIVGIERRSDARDQANRVYPFGQIQDSTIRQTIGKARWEVATVPSATTFTVTERLLFEDAHLEGNFVDDLGGGLFEIDITVESTGVITTTAAHGLSVGQLIAFRLNAAGDELAFVDSPSSQVLYGVLNGRLEATDIPPVDNLVVNPALRDFTAGAADDFVAIGSPTLSQETDAIHTRVGGSAQKVETALAGEGIKTDPIAIVAVSPDLFFSALVQVFVETGGGVEIFLDHSTEGRFPLEGSEERAFTTKAGVFIEIRIEGKEFPTGTVEVVIISRSAGTNVFYIDAVQFVQAAQAFDFFDGRSSVVLWQRGLDHLTLVNLPEIQYALPGALDLTTVREADFPFDEVTLGGNVFVRDERFNITTLTRVLQVRRDLKAGRNIALELSSRRQNIIDRLSALERRGRIEEPAGPPGPQIGSFVLTLPASEVAIALVAKGATLSYKFLATTGTPPTYDDVLATGVVSDLINGEQVLTSLILAPNETASVRLVAFSLKGGAGTPGETAAATISRVPEQVISAAATVARTTDEPIPANTTEVIFWDDEEPPPEGLTDIGQMHPPGASQQERLIVPAGAGGVYLVIGQMHAQAASTGAFSMAAKHIPTGESLGLEPFFVNNPRPEGEIVLTGWGMSLFTGFTDLVARAGDFFRLEAATTVIARTLDDVDSRFSAAFLSAESRANPRVYLRRTSGQSIPTGGGGTLLAWQAEVDDVGGLVDLGADVNRITIPAGQDGGYLFISVINWSGSSLTAERRIQIEINGSEAARVRIERTAGNTFSGAIQQQVAYMRLAAVATDFFTVRAFQDTGGALLVNIGLTYFEAYKLFPSSDLTTPRADIARTADLTVLTATPTVIPWTLENVDVGAMHDLVVNPERLTIPTGESGAYIFIVEIDWAAQAGGKREMIIRKNGTDTIGRVLYQDPDTDITQQCYAIDLTAVEGDFYEVLVEQTSGVSVNVALARSKFQASNILQLTAGG